MSPQGGKISDFDVPDLSSLPDDLKARIQFIQDKTGFVPNVFLALGHRPDELRAFMDYHDALMFREGGLTHADREMIVVAVSSLNDCQFCVIAHGAILRVRARDPLIADQVAVNYRKADITDRQRAMLEYAEKVTLNSKAVDGADFARLRDAGFDQDDIWDIGAIAAFFGMSNRLANFAGMKPNAEFYAMGR